MKKLFKTFFNWAFLKFCIIGLIAYFIHQGVYSLYTLVCVPFCGWYDDNYHLLSTAIAYIAASIFTFFLNAKVTFKSDIDAKKTIQSILVFIAKFALTELLALGIMALMQQFFSSEVLFYKIVDVALPFILTCITLILQFLAFKVIFKPKKKDNKESLEVKDDNKENTTEENINEEQVENKN